ncbi:MAG TPA: asparagine synthetase B, partial [bacterium]|nr:asparagine synthetase B [bacterium]
MIRKILLLTLLAAVPALGQRLLVYMDLKQENHLKAYGLAYWVLDHGVHVEWLLNYRGGSFLMEDSPAIERELRVRGVSSTLLSGAEVSAVYAEIERENMDVVQLEKAPAVAIYAPPNKQA